MHYIVDGYNVICSSDLFGSVDLEGRRNKLLAFISNHRPHGSPNNSITVVFDCNIKNSPEAFSYSKAHVGEIEIMFSDGYVKADDIIVQICDTEQNPLEIVVVTNDRGIHRRIGLSGAKHISVEDFIQKGFKKKNRQNGFTHKDVDPKIIEEFEKLWL